MPTLNARTERILDSVLRALNADEAILRLNEPPRRIGVQGALRVATTGGEGEITVSNGHLWPTNGIVFIYDGANSESIGYEFVRTANGFQPPNYNGVGNPPEAILRLATGLTVANAHAVGISVSIDDPLVTRTPAATAMDSGTVGVHDLGGLLRALKEDLDPVVISATGIGAADGSTIVAAATFTADAHVGDTVEMITGVGVVGDTATITANTAGALTVSPVLSVQCPAVSTFQITTTNYDNFLAVFDANIPANVNSDFQRGTADVARSPSEIATTMVNACVAIIIQYGGTLPTSESALNLLAREIDKSTILVLPALTADTVITVADASRLPTAGDLIIGTTVATIARNNAGKGGQGPNTVTLTTALGGGGEAVSAVVGPSPRGTVQTGRRHTAPAPHAFGGGMVEYITAMVTAVEAYTVPT